MSTTLPVAYSHIIEGFQKGIDQGKGPFYRVIYKIDDWSKSDAFCNALMGTASMTGPITGGTVTRNSPHQHPLSTNLFCISATVVEGLGNPVLNANGYPDYDGGALIAAEYGCLSWDAITPNVPNSIDPTTPLPYYTQDLDFTSSSFTLPNSKLKYTSGPAGIIDQPTEVYVKFEVPVTILTLTVHQLPYLPVPAIRNCRGKVNNATFLGSPAECVLFKGGKTHREPGPDGSIVQTVTLEFHERNSDQGWNALPTASDPTFYPVAGTGGVKMYKLADFSPLVQF
jgi:hypothetical protein